MESEKELMNKAKTPITSRWCRVSGYLFSNYLNLFVSTLFLIIIALIFRCFLMLWSSWMTEIMEIKPEDPKFHVLFIPGNPGFFFFIYIITMHMHTIYDHTNILVCSSYTLPCESIFRCCAILQGLLGIFIRVSWWQRIYHGYGCSGVSSLFSVKAQWVWFDSFALSNAWLVCFFFLFLQ